MKVMMLAALMGLATLGLNAEVVQNEFNGGVGFYNPCNGLLVTATGPVNLQVQTMEPTLVIGEKVNAVPLILTFALKGVVLTYFA